MKFAYICSLSETGDICCDNFLLTRVPVLYRRRSLKDTEECRICETWTLDLRIGRFDVCRPNVCVLPAKEGFVFSNGVLVIGSFSQGRANEAEELTHISAAMAVANMRNNELEAALHGSLPRPERLAELLRDWGRETELALERVKLKMRHPYLLNVLTLVSDDPEVAWRYFEWVC